ncbi:partner of Y14 and mago isoform X1 [Lycium barbarum]|uniref:partner of Y14 and mago isoform X1 n=1 Tax=Lycium barbarum TaxID=112863 RepID=UPI00293ECAEF|nr:partner of Y14 and mago isoform X1 [Lycium barbarum]
MNESDLSFQLEKERKTTMASKVEEEAKQMEAELSKTLKEGERLLAPTRRPDGTLRKPIRIRAGYVPQDEVQIYQSKGALWKKEMASIQDVPPGYEPVVMEEKPKSKAAKRNERKKEKRQQQAAAEKGKNPENDEVSSADNSVDGPDQVESVMSQINNLAISANPVVPPSNSTESSAMGDSVQDIDKKIRALKKKIRLTEAQQQKTEEKDMKPEQLEKVAKMESWRKELKLLEDKKAELEAS